jgi:hypothetical protein
MMLYNVTLNVEEDMAADFEQWMKETHIPQVMATGHFQSYRFLKLLDQEYGEGITFAVQYLMADRNTLEDYQAFHGPRLRQETLQRYGDKCVAFRTLLEVIDGL